MKIQSLVLVKRLGEGGMGDVWLAHDLARERACALKLLKDANRTGVARLIREARLVRRVQHPNVVVVHGLVRSSSGAFGLAMERLHGESMAEYIASSGAFPLPVVTRIGAALASVLGETHARRIVHRDVKPANVFLAIVGEHVVPKLLDFGIATGLDDLDPRSLQIAGTPGYMAPELAAGGPTEDGRSDIWSLGVTLYEALTGRRLFDDSNVQRAMSSTFELPIPPLRAVMPGIPHELSALIAGMLERDPSRRIGSLRTIYDVLSRYAGLAGPVTR